MLSFFLSIQFIAMPDRTDALLYNTKTNLFIESSGSLGILLGDAKCHQTYPNETIIEDKKRDWCSNVAKENEKPWIQYSFKNSAMALTGYSIRNGCCYYYDCCCDPETGEIVVKHCCCELYSFSLLGSNNNKTWEVIHKVTKDDEFYWCKLMTYEFPKTQSFQYIRFVMDEPRPYCPRCMQINQLELYGEKHQSFSTFEENGEESEESVSIIGKVKHL